MAAAASPSSSRSIGPSPGRWGPMPGGSAPSSRPSHPSFSGASVPAEIFGRDVSFRNASKNARLAQPPTGVAKSDNRRTEDSSEIQYRQPLLALRFSSPSESHMVGIRL